MLAHRHASPNSFRTPGSVALSVDVYVLLDVLLLILIALFIPIGFWRGAFREAFVTLGILFGATMAFFWGESWGAELASITRLHESGGAFMVAMLCLISSTFLLGYSAGAAVPVPTPGYITRSLGALVAGANGALLLSFALRDIRVYLLSAQDTNFLDNAVIAPFLSEGGGWILLIAAAIFVPVALVVAIFGPETEVDDYYETGEYDTFDDEGAEHYPRRPVPVESRPPSPQFGARPQQGVAVEETRQYSPPDDSQQPVGAGNEDPGRNERPAQSAPLFGFRPESSGRSSGESAPGAQAVAPQRETTEQRSDNQNHTVPVSAAEPEQRPRRERKPVPPGVCPNCHADIGDAEGYCPSCGRVI
jgi:uncharacterized membrane protein required for colicin V production